MNQPIPLPVPTPIPCDNNMGIQLMGLLGWVAFAIVLGIILMQEK